jgi:hypothetical protein
MDFSELRGIDLALFLRGIEAAKRGEPFDETRIDPWRDGYLYWQRQLIEKREKNACH